MAGVIDQLAAETRDLDRKEAARVAANDRDAAAARAVAEREETAAARVLAMRAARSLTGRVIFPARWEVVPLDRPFRHCLRETIEGKVTIWVYMHSGHVESILVSVGPDGNSQCVTWKPSRYGPPARWPVSPGRDWFRRALVDLGVI